MLIDALERQGMRLPDICDQPGAIRQYVAARVYLLKSVCAGNCASPSTELQISEAF